MKLGVICAFLISSPLFFVITSCGRYIDKIGSKENAPIKQGYFNFYIDSNTLIYNSNITLTRDAEKTYPKQFMVRLPKGIKYYELTGSTDFEIYYDNKQVVYIRIDLEDDKIIDTSYVPSKKNLDFFIQSKPTSSKTSYDITKINFNESRRHLLIRKNAATILLYNIKPVNFDLFSTYISNFSFIK